MSAVEVIYPIPATSRPAPAPRFHVVREGEISANFRRKAFAHGVARAHTVVTAKTYTALGSMLAVFTAAVGTIVWAFLSIPNTPLP